MVDVRLTPTFSFILYYIFCHSSTNQDFWSNGAPPISAFLCRTNGWVLLIQTLSFCNCRCFKKHCESSLQAKLRPQVIWPPSFWATPAGSHNRNERA